MFDLPAAKRLKRSELLENLGDPQANDTSESTGVKTAAEDNPPSYGFEYEFITQQPADPPSDAQEPDSHAKEEAFQFNLFRPASKTKDDDQLRVDQPEIQPALISLRSPSPQPISNTNLHFQTKRPDSHYFTASLPPETLNRLRTNYSQSAITAATIQSRASQPWPGAHLPWRAISLPAHRKQIVVHKPPISANPPGRSTLNAPAERDLARQRARPSKKRRDLLKLKAQRRARVIDESKTKEEHEREKRSRKNRERKLKRRAKERKEKEEARSKDGDGDGKGSWPAGRDADGDGGSGGGSGSDTD